MTNLFFIIGRSGVGKDTVVKELIRQYKGELTNIVPYTTRPPRFNETNGVDYNFVDRSVFDEMVESAKFLETRSYKVEASGGAPNEWCYATPIPDKNIVNGVSIVTFEAFSNIINNRRNAKMLNSAAENISVIVLTADQHTLLMRAINREESHKLYNPPNYVELCRRFVADSNDFVDMVPRLKRLNTVSIDYNGYGFTIHNINTTNMTVDETVNILKGFINI